MERISGTTFLLALVTITLTGCGANYLKTPASAVSTPTSTSEPTESALPAPTFSMAGGSFASAQTVSLSSSVSGAVIHYTVDGTTPTTASPVYTAAVAVAQTTTIEAIAAGVTGYAQSAVAAQTYTIGAAAPLLKPASGTYTNAVSVTISDSNSGDAIYYTTDGSAPTAASTRYSGPITIPSEPITETIRAFATADGVNGSTASATYTISPAQSITPTPTITPASGTYTTNSAITINDAWANAKLYYTLNGNTPTTQSTLYTAPFLLPATQTGTTVVKAIAVLSGYGTSGMAQSSITMNLPNGVIATTVVNSTLPTVTIPTDFLGYSHSWDAAATILGDSTTGTNYIYRQLTSNLSTLMGGPLVVRIGGEPATAATQETVRPFFELAQASGVKLLLSVNLANGDLALAQQQAETYMAYVPSNALQGIEIGNEPDWYSLAGVRPATYAYTDFFSQYQEWANGLSAVSSGSAPVAGPVFGSIGWIPNATTDVANTTMKAAIVTQHHYVACYYADAPLATNILLQPSSTSGVLPYFQPYVVAAHQAGAPFRVAELNSICLGGQPGVSNSFSSALWGIDMMFGLASIGVDGVNWHTDSDGGVYDLYHFFSFKNVYYLDNVNPVFYGLQFFAGAAGNGAQLLNTGTLSASNIKVWVTQNSQGHAHLMIINKEISTSGNVQVTMPGYSTGVVSTLIGANYLATSGITMGGQTYDGSTDGTLQGTPVTQTITPQNGVWTVPVQAMSAVSVDLHN